MKNNQLFQTNKNCILQIWDKVQKLQTDLCFPLEISSYYLSNFWGNNISTVLDVGTGNGYFLEKLLDTFPDKKFCGIDTSSELINTAKAVIKNKNIDFVVKDFFSENEQYDFVITRLLWQHLNRLQVEKGLSKLREITRPGGSVLIMDAMDEARLFYPELPEFDKVITEYKRKKLVEEQRDRDIVQTIHDWAKQEEGWAIGLKISIIVPSTIPGNINLFHQIYGLWLDLFEATGELDFDLQPARKELEAWKKEKNSYAQVGMSILRLDLKN